MVVAGTKAWRNNEKGKGYQEIEVSSLLQMIGRAGRAGLDSTGVAVVLTDNSSKKRIERLLDAGIGPAKSNLVSRLPEVLNSEIAQRVVTSEDEALRWMQTTFLYCTLKRNQNGILLAKRIIGDAMRRLTEIGVVECRGSHSIHPRLGCFIMNRHLVSFEQMKTIASLPFGASQCQILRAMSKLENLQSFVKRNEKRELKEFHKSNLMKYKLPGALSKFVVRDPSEKAFILLQSYISRHKFDNHMLNDEQVAVSDEATKFLEVAQEYSAKASKLGKVALECYKLQRSLTYCLWGESSGVFNQFDWIGSSSTISNALRSNGIRSFQDVLDVTEEQLDEIFERSQGRLPKNAGRIVKHTARDLCRNRLVLHTDIEYTKNSHKPTDLICSLKFHDPISTMAGEREQDIKFTLVAYTSNSDNSSLIFEENISSPSNFRVPLPSNSFEKIFVHLVGTWVGFDQKEIIGSKTFLPSYRSNVRMYQDPSKINVESDPKNKKRKCPIESDIFQDRRQNEKRHCTADIQGKEPSPITPQPNDRNPGASRTVLATNRQSSAGTWNESENGDRATASIGLRYSTPQERTRGHEMPLSINDHTTMRVPKKHTSTFFPEQEKKLQRRYSNLDGIISNFAPETLVTPHVNDGRIDVSAPEKHCRRISRGQYNVSNGEIEEFPSYGASSRATPNGRDKRIQKQSGNERMGRFDRSIEFHSSTNESKKLRQDNRGKSIWNQSRQKQQRAQKRAFTEKKMNPFGNFSHDPNDFERHLEHLSQQSSIIPYPLLAKMKQSSIASNGNYQHHFPGDGDRRSRTARHRRLNNQPQHILREKAIEQQSQHEQRMSKRSLYEDGCHHFQPFSMGTRQQGFESFPCPQADDKTFGPFCSPRKESGPGSHRPTPGDQYKPYIQSPGIESNSNGFPPEPIFRRLGEYEQGINTDIDSYRSSRINVDDRLQHEMVKKSPNTSRQPSYSSHLNFDSVFR